MYTPAATFRRTSAERSDQQLAWDRSDQAFFAAGACHILALAFAAGRPSFRIAGLRKAGERHPSHIIATNTVWAFDHDGWTLESELLAVTAEFEPETPWELERLILTEDLATFCQNHDLRPPDKFANDPWRRAMAYIATFPLMPPAVSSRESR